MKITVNTLDGLSEGDAAVYSRGEDSRYHLYPELVAVVERHAAELAERDAVVERAAKLDRQLTRVEGRAGFRNALAKAGVRRELLEVGVALAAETYRVTLDSDGTAMVETPFGRMNFDHAVAALLATDEGQALAPQRATAKGAGFYLERVRGLKAALH